MIVSVANHLPGARHSIKHVGSTSNPPTTPRHSVKEQHRARICILILLMKHFLRRAFVSLAATCRLYLLDWLLGNADRLACQPLNWRGNPENLRFCTRGPLAGRMVAIDAVVQRRPPGDFPVVCSVQKGALLHPILLCKDQRHQLQSYEFDTGWHAIIYMSDLDVMLASRHNACKTI